MSLEPSNGGGGESGGGLTEYIVHHLTHNVKQTALGPFHVDSWLISLILGLLGCLWL